MFFHFRRASQNRKLGPMPAVMASAATCPTSCGLRGAGCYAEHGPGSIFWRALTAGTAVNQVTLEQLCHLIRALPKRIRWRYGTAGDLPPAHDDVLALARANGGREAIVFTHGRQYETYRAAGKLGFHINCSTDSAAHADALLDEAPDMSVVTVLPSDAGRGRHRTPAGREIAVCPATYAEQVTCSTCNLCSRARPRGVIVGFPAHGTRKRMIDRRLAQS